MIAFNRFPVMVYLLVVFFNYPQTIKKIFRFTEDLHNHVEFENDTESFDAAIMNFIILGENVARLSDTFKEKHNHVDWHKIYAFRNVLAHDYFGILPQEVWEIIVKHLPKLQTDIEQIIK